jgi:peptidoglycan/LPS O-acetylase OafA/YrhL
MKPVQSAEAAPRPRIPNLDGVRALAILMVMAYHLFAMRLLDQTNRTTPGDILRWITGPGWLGVDLFFILSGYLITGMILSGSKKPRFYRNFYTRRLLRIIPLYMVVLTAVSLYYAMPFRWWLLCAGFGANLTFLFGMSLSGAMFPFWSLAVEEHYYLFWPTIAKNLSLRWAGVFCAGIFVVEPLLRFHYIFSHTMDVYVATWFRLDGLAAGSLLALYYRSTARSRKTSFRIAVTCVAAAIPAIVGLARAGAISSLKSPFSEFRPSVAYLLFTALMIAAIELPASRWTALLRTRFATLTANLSFCMYLVHAWIADMLDRAIGFPQNVSGTVIRALVVVLATYAVAMISRKYLELPFLRMRPGETKRQLPEAEAALATTR